MTPPVIGTYDTHTGVTNSYWWIKKWDIGTTEPGSSGGPLFNEANLMIGTLQGGFATCESSLNDYYVMLVLPVELFFNSDQAIEESGLIRRIQEHQRSKRWILTASGATCDQFSDVVSGERYEAAKVIDGKGYISGHNSYRITEYAQAFNLI